MKSITLFIFAFSSTTALASSDHSSRMTGWQAFAEIQNGNMRFSEKKVSHPNQGSERRVELATSQKPHTIILSCSDSRLPPELVFDQGLGDLFVVRVAGNVVNDEGIASIEYAISHLGAKLLLIMGHESCGAVGAAVHAKSGTSNGSESLDILVKHIRSGMSNSSIAAARDDSTFRQGVKENVEANARLLLKKSSIVRDAVAKKGLVMGDAIYSIKTGKVEFWNLSDQLPGAVKNAGMSGPAIEIEQIVEESLSESKKNIKSEKKTKESPTAAPAHAH